MCSGSRPVTHDHAPKALDVQSPKTFDSLRIAASSLFGIALATLIAWQGPAQAQGNAAAPPAGSAPTITAGDPTGGSQLAQLEASIVKDPAYISAWSGPRDDLDLFLSACSYVMVKEDRALPNPVDLQHAKLFKPAMALASYYLRAHDFPVDFKARFDKHLDAIRDDPRHGVRDNLDELAARHDYAALAAWARPNDPTYLRELIAEQQSPLARHRLEAAPSALREPRRWLIDPSVANERLSRLTDEERREN